jgi:hypothetical protein
MRSAAGGAARRVTGRGTRIPAIGRRGTRHAPGKLRFTHIRTEASMAVCDNCGNDYDKSFDIVRNGERRTFDCFECAIHAMAPACTHCGTRIIGHGLEKDGTMFCCDHCAEAAGVTGLRDRL